MEITNNKDLGVRFTDDRYAKKDEVKLALNTSLIDPIWVKIYSYRAKFFRQIPLNNQLKLSYFICNTPTIVQKMNETNSTLLKCLNTYNDLNVNEQLRIKRLNKQEIVRDVALYYGETLTEAAMSAVINNSVNNVQGVSEAKKKASNYYRVHEKRANAIPIINQDYLTQLYIDLTGQEITTLYRNFSFDNVDSLAIKGVDTTQIERMMNNFYTFLQDARVSTLVKAAATYFFINFVKPFASMNEEIAMLTFKSVFASDKFETITYLLPFENFLVKEKEFALEFKEVVRGGDLTYVVIKIIDLMNDCMNKFLRSCANEKAGTMINEYHEEKVAPSPAPINEHAEITTNSAATSTLEIKPTQNIAISKIEASLDEKDANKFERYLLEKDPRLKKKQAHFLARHCTLGSYYTIQMFKKKERVVYETARTSMDALTNLGYYRKEQIKNKFVYTPNKIEGK